MAAGHEVGISNSRGPDSPAEFVADLGPSARALTVEGATDLGEVVLETIPFGEYRCLPAEALAGKTVISSANYYPGHDGEIGLEGRTGTELVAAHLVDSTVVEAFNTVYYETPREEAPLEDRLVLFLAGDDPGAKSVVSGLIEGIGFAPLDVGSLREGVMTEPGSAIYNEPMHLERARTVLEELRE